LLLRHVIYSTMLCASIYFFFFALPRFIERIRLYLEKITNPELKSLIEEIIGKPVLDLMTNTNLATGRTGIIVIFNQLPEVCNPESISQGKCQEFS
ncbi:MAG: Na-translocating system protein MpsC family protein, partial [Nostoc sp.]|uniref:Na-translocating system protein MpsC family protein n=1 Tax=Nostoc sp. TaxID=1180 RepID=UPI002FFB3FA9